MKKVSSFQAYEELYQQNDKNLFSVIAFFQQAYGLLESLRWVSEMN